ncbi:histidine kinase [Curtobacterium sp. MCLR17_054]|uniref:sensor histidine kinase n=1 Tax=Curtobacterium sp. MCLR17_054 TaxID=2175632 RepID=UPI0011B36052|nr:histidine kinase [Curtobacterium sp. MCLR17_054]WIE68904.1 histidine kinase [Curtobacterium sp. MCLR17_054]
MAPAEHDALRAPAEPAAQRARRVDVFVALGTAVVALGLLLGLPPLDALEPDGPALAMRVPAPFTLAWSVLALGLLAQSAALLAARRAPRTVLIVVAALPVVVAALAPQSSDLFGLTALPVVVAVVLAALRVPLARLWSTLVVAAALAAAGNVVLAVTGDTTAAVSGSLGQGVLQAIGAVCLPLLVTLLVQSRREVRVARTAEASAVNREQDALVDAAVSRERAAMARELHDIAAHHLSGIALMAAVIDRQIDADPERAHEGARQVREQSTAVLEDLRRLAGLLRDDAPAERAVETVAGIVDLAERARFRSDVRLDVLPGDRPLADGVGPLAQLAAYRTVQEALANAALHAPSAPCTVTIDDRDATRVVIRVENAPATVPAAGTSPSGGNGLRGMRERADLVGARLQTGPTATGGWLVELALGREAPPAPAQAADGTGVVA